MAGQKKEVRPGVWKLRVSAGKDPVSGKYVYVSKTIHGGPRIADKELAKLVASAHGSAVSITVEALIEEVFARVSLAPTTLRNYRGAAANHVFPALGGLSIEKLTARHLDNLYGDLLDRGVGIPTIRYAHALISRSLSQAVKWDWLHRNVAMQASPPPPRRTIASAPSPEELAKILSGAFKRSPQMAAVFALAAVTGARRGELIALRWSDFKPESRELAISKSVCYTPRDGVFVKTTKTDSVHRIAVDDVIESLLISQMDELKTHVELGFELALDPYLFPGDPGGFMPLHPDTPSKFFRKICDSLGLPYHLHQLRHFTATELIGAGYDPRTVGSRLGHTDSSMILKVYAHALEARDRSASEYLGKLVAIPRQLGNAPKLDS